MTARTVEGEDRMTGVCTRCQQEKTIVRLVYLNRGDEKPSTQYCEDCFDKIAPYRMIHDESTAYGVDCRDGKCEW